MNKIKIHHCGCKTRKVKGGVVIWACRKHRENDKWIYIGLQHEGKKKK